MKKISILKPGLFIYECIRIILIFALMFRLPLQNFIPVLAFAAPNALFPLMSLFICLNISRYKTFIPLFIAGKCIGIFSLLGWSIIAKIPAIMIITGVPFGRLFPDFFLCGDLFALAAILFINATINKPTAIAGILDSEEKQ
ncbi:MAG: hypothetical protein LBI12_05495 [Treponema sp.]|jgi:hypothetical protein|nr:hypothetical protein [Treponema sp.]